MGRIIVEKTGQNWTAVNKLSPDEEVNQHEYEAVSGGAFSGLLPVAYKSEKKSRVLTCLAVAMVPLRTYFSGIVTRKMFTDTVSRLITMAKDCEKNQLDARNLYLSLDYIFVEPRTKEIRCILWPLTGSKNARDPVEFFRELPYTLVFNKHEDCAYVADYVQFFRAAPGALSMRDFEQFFDGGGPGSQPAEAQVAGAPEAPYDPVKRIIENSAGQGQRNVCPSCGIVNAMGAKICVSCGASLIAQDGNMDTQMKSGTAVLGHSPGSTGITSEESPYPYLIRESTNQIISVDKPAFSIGKDKNVVDFCVTGNTAVSRSHVVIYTREDRYFIVDQNSTNKTYIDGRAIPPNEEIEIFPGAKIKLANEEFVFYI